MFGLLMIILIIIGLNMFFPLYFKGFLHHPILTIKNAYKDIYKYIKFKEYNRCNNVAYLNLYTAYSNQVFGCGKTLTMVRDALSLYYKYDGKLVYDYDKEEFVVQHVNLISNIRLNGVRYYRFVDEHQFTEFEKFKFEPQDINVFMIDEMQALYDSRSFKDNISSEFMTRFLQCRKNKVIILGTAQRFGRCDKFLREMTSTVVACTKTWRNIFLRYYNASTVEHMDDVTMLIPEDTSIWLATDKAFNAYDTNELVEKLKNVEYISDQEIIQNRDNAGNEFDILKYKNKIRQRKKKKGAA